MLGSNLGTRIFTWLRGEEVGRDEQGNIYYREKRRSKSVHRDSLRKERRWVIYNGEVEASRVPPEWNAWLHATVDETPDQAKRYRPNWQKAHQPNLTGTPQAYRPPGHTLRGGQRAPATGDYAPWTPD